MRSFWLPCLLMIAVRCGESSPSISRDEFPKEFVFGSGTSAYQVEGAAAEDGRTPSIWDTFAHNGYVQGTGDITSDEYHKYKEDVKLMKEVGLEGYRFSLSWSRLIPEGRGRVNPKGREYYNNLINELISNGRDDFTAYADVCFREFGDRVSHWTTINEPITIASYGYDLGIIQPKRCSHPFGNCSTGNSVVEPYIVVHHLLLAHGSAASLYKKYYQSKQQGFIGLNILAMYFLPKTNSTEDVNATKRAQDFVMGCFIEPLVHGDYPESIRKAAGKKLPIFSSKQSKQVMNSFDFFGVNYYVTTIVRDKPNYVSADQRDYLADLAATFGYDSTEGGQSEAAAFNAAFGLQGVLEYFKQNYGNPPIYIYENGYPTPSNATLDDTRRVKHMSEHFSSLRDAIKNGSNAKGFFTWSFLDVFELLGGYNSTFGLYHVDFEDEGRRRSPKLSAHWYSNFLKKRGKDIYGGNTTSDAHIS